MDIKIEVEYCGTCGYGSKFEELSKVIQDKFPDVQIEGHEGRRATFEVKVNGTLVHSKLTTMSWPDPEDMLQIIEDVTEGKEVRQAKSEPWFNCTIT